MGGLNQQVRAGKTTEKRRYVYVCGHGVQKEKDKRCKIFKNGKLGAVGDRPPVLLRTGDRKLENPNFCSPWKCLKKITINYFL